MVKMVIQGSEWYAPQVNHASPTFCLLHCESVSISVSQSVSQSASLSVDLSLGLSVGRSVGQSVSQLVIFKSVFPQNIEESCL